MTDITVGGLRDRLIHDAVWETLHDILAAQGWLTATESRGAVQLVPKPPVDGDEVPVNTAALTLETTPGTLLELGSELTEDQHTFFFDFWAEDDAVGLQVTGDVRDALRGLMPAIGRGYPVIEVLDRTQQPPPTTPLFSCPVQDVVRDKAPRTTSRAWEQHWYYVRFDVLDEHL